MKIFCYFVEPASYTLDLAKNVYDKNKIDYCFIKSYTLVKSNSKSNKEMLSEISIFNKIRFILKIFKENKMIIVNGYNNYPFILTFILNIFSCNKRYVAIESDTQLQIPTNLLTRFIKWIYLSIIFKNKYVLGFSGGSNSHKDLFRHYGMEDNRIFLMPMMVDNSKFYQKNKALPEVFCFLYVGRLLKHKNVEELIKVFKSRFSTLNAVLRIVGDGEEKRYLIEKYQSEKVKFLGMKYTDDLIQEIQNASCFVCPSIFEPWGLVVNEALSSGLPVIATKEVGATFDLIIGRETGYVAADMLQFGEYMVEAFDNPKKLQVFSKNGSDLMQNVWNYDFYNNCLKNTINEVKKWH
jgi:glycosyltransferase involved in cell wall biosynthesis